ncbi:slightly ste11-like protein [Paecilomyces lecythidis]|uniref:Slightly ste11-like protein n=1 Tax=Paecilomyces lecythidis TaxID=3004212 RepID=A0ABR3Y6Z5_9EURO
MALYYDPARNTLPRPSTSLLEHKIMNDSFSKVTLPQRDASILRSSGQNAEPGPAPAPLSQAHLASINRDKVALNSISSRTSLTRERLSPVLTADLPESTRSSSSSPPKSASSKEATQFCLCQPDPKIPRPRNAFILYRQHYQAAVVAQNPGLANPEISKIIGEQWRALPEEAKKEWKALAEEEKARHQQQYPDYRYQPRRYGRDGSSRGTKSSGISHNPPGATSCNRCGGRIMHPPSTPDTPFTPSGQTIDGRREESLPISVPSLPSRGRETVRPSSVPDQRASRPYEEDEGSWSPDPKRRRFNVNGIYPNGDRNSSPDMAYPPSPQRTYARSDPTHNRLPFQMLPPPKPYQYRDPSLKLPPLKTATSPNLDRQDLKATVMTIPSVNKVKVLAKISPPYSSGPKSAGSSAVGSVIAVDGQDPALVKDMVRYLGSLLTKEGKYAVRVFEGPEIRPRQTSSQVGEMGDATVDYLNTISAWHRISDEMVNFITSRSRPRSDHSPQEPGSAVSITSRTAKLDVNSPTSSAPASPQGPIPIAIVPRYQLTTADSFACAIPINDSYAPLDHWQWMASLWRACIGPDITVHIQECDKEELDRYGGGTPVEVRLSDARMLIVRKGMDPSKDIDEKALRRVGFEVEDFLTK